jgi:hypothetical protein
VKLQEGERLIKQQDNAVWVRGTFNNAVGKLILTNQRLAFEQRSVIQSSILGQLGVVGTIADEALPRNIVVNIPLEQLAAFSPVKVASSRKVLPVITKNGVEFLFSGPKFEQWAPILLQAGLYEAAQASGAPNQTAYGQQAPQGQQPVYPAGYAPPQRQAGAKTGIPWWGWLLIVGGIVILACAAVVISLAVIGSAVSGATPSGGTATLGWPMQVTAPW